VIGLNRLSELYVEDRELASDFQSTRGLFGIRQGLLRPRPEIVISTRMYRQLRGTPLRGVDAEGVRSASLS
jgi:hypothetical protein